MITETDKAWLAGVIDARGYQYLHQKNIAASGITISWRLKDDLDVITRACAMTGLRVNLTVHTSGAYRRQCVEHCPAEHVHVKGWNEYERLSLQGNKCLIVINNCLPYFTRDYKPLRDWIAANVRMRTRVVREMATIGWDVPVIPVCNHSEGCDLPVRSKGMCDTHYKREWQRSRRS